MKKRILFFGLSIIILATGFFVINNYEPLEKKEIKEFGGIHFPPHSTYTVNDDGDIKVTLGSAGKLYYGDWEKGSVFQFDADKIKSIIPIGGFRFAEIQFKGARLIEFTNAEPNTLHTITLTNSEKLDGLDLDIGCKVQLKNLVLYSANCKKFGEVYFKRFVEFDENQESTQPSN